MSEPPSDRPRRLRADSLALAFVGVALVLLLLAPLLTARRTADLRGRIEDVAEPARDATTQVQFELARQMSALRGFLLTGDTAFIARYNVRLQDQQATMDELMILSVDLGPEAAAAAATLRHRVQRWHDQVDPGAPGEPQRPTDVSILIDQRLYEEAVRSAVELDRVVGGIAREMRARIRTAESQGFLLSLTRGVIALLATGVLIWFGRRLRALAAEAERQRRDAEVALQATSEASRARDRVIRGVTHDVKNPLGAADGYAELLEMGLRGALSPEQLPMIAAIRRSLRSALAIIDDLLDLSRAERRELPFSPREVALDELVARIAESHRGAIEATGQTLQIDVPAAPVIAETDPVRTEQVVGNLLSNAAKYGGKGVVEVSLSTVLEGPAGDGGYAHIVVRDEGPGIPGDQLETIFEEFHRVRPDQGRGHGLGLAIARHVARQVGGDLTVESAAGAGAAFTFRIPLRRPVANGRPAPAAQKRNPS